MHNKTKKKRRPNTELPQTMGGTQNSESTTAEPSL